MIPGVMSDSGSGPPRIVVGVDGSQPSFEALEWAAREARLRGARLEVLHATFYRLEMLQLFPGAAKALVEASAGAELLVVGSRGLGGFDELVMGSVSHQCAHHGQCPVVIIRGGRSKD